VDPVPDPLLFFLVVPGIEPGPPDLYIKTKQILSELRSLFHRIFEQLRERERERDGGTAQDVDVLETTRNISS
jgi:hypothetical protein